MKLLRDETTWTVAQYLNTLNKRIAPIYLIDFRDISIEQERTCSTTNAEVIHTLSVARWEFFNYVLYSRTVRELSKVYIYGGDNRHVDIALWHEVGHVMHRVGHLPDGRIENELGANTWLLQNYNGPEDIDFLRVVLGKWFDTYLLHPDLKGEPVSYSSDLYNTAKFLCCENNINWK